MGKTIIHLVRHAQGTHNLPNSDLSIQDPPLTPFGISQCVALSNIFPHPSKVTHLVSSPLRRTLYTTIYSFPEPISRGLKITAQPLLQELSSLGADTGISPTHLASEFAGTKYASSIDLSHVTPDWNSKSGIYSSDAATVEKRALNARKWLRELGGRGEEDKEIVVVTHGGFLHFLTQDWVGNEEIAERVRKEGYVFRGGEPTGWSNTEFRSYEFVEGDEENAGLRELEESRARRMGKETELGTDEKRELASLNSK